MRKIEPAGFSDQANGNNRMRRIFIVYAYLQVGISKQYVTLITAVI
jgi:hypothetical protein